MQSVKAWEERIIIPTYETGAPDRNPMFLEKRVYQGSSGVVYPHPVIDKVSDEKKNKEYTALYLENDYLKIMVLPELGGRIQMAYDKTNDYHFIYYNPVIKPALVGLTGPWISGGIEFNWPQHHRPSTFNPVDYTIEENADGSKTIWINETEIMFHTKGSAGFTLYPGKAYLEVKGKLYNRTPFPQTFLWWANPAVEVDEHYQSVFPPDVNAVYDHGKRDVSSFPIATGTYYKVDYSPGTDISHYQNIPVPTSYMAVNSDFDFVGGYHHQKKAGLLHVADHHISPGKKQWTWGSGAFGKMWDKHLTDPNEKGEYPPYFELMTGVFTDNQPDFGWIMPNEERTFRQYFMPYKEIGYVKNATKNAAVNLEVINKKIIVSVYATSVQHNARIVLTAGENILFDEYTDLSPEKIFTQEYTSAASFPETDLSLKVFGKDNELLVHYSPGVPAKESIPDPAMAIGDPASIKTNEALYLAGLHLEQYRHATYSPVWYYEEALVRDPADIRCNNALGLWYVKHGQHAKAKPYFHNAIDTLNRHNPNPYNGEPYYNLGLCLVYQEQWDAAYDTFYKATWNATWQDNAFLQLAYIDCRKGNFSQALDHVEHSLARNYHGIKARHLKAILLRKTGRMEDAEKWIQSTLAIDLFDFSSRNEWCSVLMLMNKNEEAKKQKAILLKLIRGWEQSYLETAIDYANAGCYAEAINWLKNIDNSPYPMIHYYLAYYYSKLQKETEKEDCLQKAFQLSPAKVFPNRLEDIQVLQFALQENAQDYKALYYLGNLWYDKRAYEQAKECWEKSVAIYDRFSTTHRNLGIVYYNKYNLSAKALKQYEKAFQADTSDARVLFELDQLYKLLNYSVADRLLFLQKYIHEVNARDDLYIEYVTLHNLLGQYEKAAGLLAKRRFHPWEGGEGKVSRQYVYGQIGMAEKALNENNTDKAIRLLEEAQRYPENLGEGKLYGQQENDIFYWLGCAYDMKGEKQSAETAWQKAASGLSEPSQAIYYNDQDPALIFYQGLALLKLDKISEAKERFNNLIHYGREHLSDSIKIDFFAVSLPELSVFEMDVNQRNRIHCHYLMGLGYVGLGEKELAEEHLQQVLAMDISHQGAMRHLQFSGIKTI